MLLYKLLVHCTDIGTLYLLIRPKKGVEPGKRLQELKNHFLLQKIEHKAPGKLEKLRIIQGDSQEKGVCKACQFYPDESIFDNRVYVLESAT